MFYYFILRYITLYYIILYYVILYIILYYVILRYIILRYIMLYYITFYYIILHTVHNGMKIGILNCPTYKCAQSSHQSQLLLISTSFSATFFGSCMLYYNVYVCGWELNWHWHNVLAESAKTTAGRTILLPYQRLHMQLILLISWWWTRNVSETCRGLTGNKVLWRDICWLFLDKLIHDARNIEHKMFKFGERQCKASTNYWGLTIWYVFFILLVSIIICRVCQLTISYQARVTQQLRISLSDLFWDLADRVFSWTALAGGPERNPSGPGDVICIGIYINVYKHGKSPVVLYLMYYLQHYMVS
jgi:hypothetical protein